MAGKRARQQHVARSWDDIVLKVLKQNEVRLVTYVPDRVRTSLIAKIHADPFFTAFATTREEEAIGRAEYAHASSTCSARRRLRRAAGSCARSASCGRAPRSACRTLSTTSAASSASSGWRPPTPPEAPDKGHRAGNGALRRIGINLTNRRRQSTNCAEPQKNILAASDDAEHSPTPPSPRLIPGEAHRPMQRLLIVRLQRAEMTHRKPWCLKPSAGRSA